MDERVHLDLGPNLRSLRVFTPDGRVIEIVNSRALAPATGHPHGTDHQPPAPTIAPLEASS